MRRLGLNYRVKQYIVTIFFFFKKITTLLIFLIINNRNRSAWNNLYVTGLMSISAFGEIGSSYGSIDFPNSHARFQQIRYYYGYLR